MVQENLVTLPASQTGQNTQQLFAMETFKAAAKADVGNEICACVCACVCV